MDQPHASQYEASHYKALFLQISKDGFIISLSEYGYIFTSFTP